MEDKKDSIVWYGGFVFLIYFFYILYAVAEQIRHISAKADYSRAPWWVKTTLWLVHLRTLAIKSLIGCYLLLFLIVVQYPFGNFGTHEIFLLVFVLLMIFAYHLSIRWMEINESWGKEI